MIAVVDGRTTGGASAQLQSATYVIWGNYLQGNMTATSEASVGTWRPLCLLERNTCRALFTYLCTCCACTHDIHTFLMAKSSRPRSDIDHGLASDRLTSLQACQPRLLPAGDRRNLATRKVSCASADERCTHAKHTGAHLGLPLPPRRLPYLSPINSQTTQPTLYRALQPKRGIC